jgi:hypothetical protein
MLGYVRVFICVRIIIIIIIIICIHDIVIGIKKISLKAK